MSSEVSFDAISFLNETLRSAQAKQASDIHLEMHANGMQVKLRLDGILWPEANVANIRHAEQLISRVKVLAQLDIAERRTPQDGRFKSELGDSSVDIRVSIMPSVVGEDAVLRLLDKGHLLKAGETLRLENLGFNSATCEKLRTVAALPYGMMLVTGPTGSGKTTTLYALLSEMMRSEEKTITIEDPVEYRIEGLLQIPVNEKKGLSFATGLRSILRHDPDRLLVGEIRDAETAEISVQAALTGHQVFTSIHANGVFDVINRFAHLGCDLHALAGALNGVVAQRLLRKRCFTCGENVAMRHQCGACRGTGFHGRVAIAEVLQVDEQVRTMLVERRPSSELAAYAMKHGFEPLYDIGFVLVEKGITTQQELDRVCKKMQ